MLRRSQIQSRPFAQEERDRVLALLESQEWDELEKIPGQLMRQPDGGRYAPPAPTDVLDTATDWQEEFRAEVLNPNFLQRFEAFEVALLEFLVDATPEEIARLAKWFEKTGVPTTTAWNGQERRVRRAMEFPWEDDLAKTRKELKAIREERDAVVDNDTYQAFEDLITDAEAFLGMAMKARGEAFALAAQIDPEIRLAARQTREEQVAAMGELSDLPNARRWVGELVETMERAAAPTANVDTARALIPLIRTLAERYRKAAEGAETVETEEERSARLDGVREAMREALGTLPVPHPLRDYDLVRLSHHIATGDSTVTEAVMATILSQVPARPTVALILGSETGARRFVYGQVPSGQSPVFQAPEGLQIRTLEFTDPSDIPARLGYVDLLTGIALEEMSEYARLAKEGAHTFSTLGVAAPTESLKARAGLPNGATEQIPVGV